MSLRTKKKKIILFIFVAIALFSVGAFIVFAADTSARVTIGDSLYGMYDSRCANTSLRGIDINSTCSADLFFPSMTTAELDSFLENHPACADVVDNGCLDFVITF